MNNRYFLHYVDKDSVEDGPKISLPLGDIRIPVSFQVNLNNDHTND
ncbi:hypothetical protein [Lactobacillus amylovorus]|nr:hypothetical protein [Lactobacillus amylovorus]MDB6225394.1 hypothetical protein [Lactobacillus amylovorus]